MIAISSAGARYIKSQPTFKHYSGQKKFHKWEIILGVSPDVPYIGFYLFWERHDGTSVQYGYFFLSDIPTLSYYEQRLFYDYADLGSGDFGGYFYLNSIRPNLTDVIPL